MLIFIGDTHFDMVLCTDGLVARQNDLSDRSSEVGQAFSRIACAVLVHRRVDFIGEEDREGLVGEHLPETQPYGQVRHCLAGTRQGVQRLSVHEDLKVLVDTDLTAFPARHPVQQRASDDVQGREQTVFVVRLRARKRKR